MNRPQATLMGISLGLMDMLIALVLLVGNTHPVQADPSAALTLPTAEPPAPTLTSTPIPPAKRGTIWLALTSCALLLAGLFLRHQHNA